MRRALAAGVALLGLAASAAASAAPVDTLREFVRDVKSGHAQFTQTVLGGQTDAKTALTTLQQGLSSIVKS